MRRIGVSILLALAPLALHAANDYEHVQSLRERADTLLEASDPSKLRNAEELLQSALAYLATPEVRERATGNESVYSRRADVLRDLAAVHAKLGEKTRALDELEAMANEAWSPGMVKFLDATPAFDALREEPRYKAVIANLRRGETLWDNPSLATPYRDKLPVEERIAGLSAFWAEARAGFVHFDHVPALDWDKTYLEFLPKVIAAETTRDYYDVMMRVAPLLEDGHTNIYAPEPLRDQFYSRPPLRTARVETQVIVTAVHSPSLARRVHVGDAIVAIDGVDVDRYAAERVVPYVSASTAQDRDVRTFGYQLLSGPADRAVKLKLRDARGVEREESVARSGWSDVVEPKTFETRMLDGGVAYFSLDDFESDAPVKAFEAFLPRIAKSKGLVIDLRRNGGGSSSYALEILSYLTVAPVPSAHSVARGDTALRRAWGGPHVQWQSTPGDAETYTLVRDKRFDGPVVVLIGPQTFSAGEDFAMAFDVLNRGVLVGAATGGSTGQPLMFKLPGGGVARICVKRDSYPDGRALVGKGVEPSIVVTPTVEDVRKNRDAALERARRELLKIKS